MEVSLFFGYDVNTDKTREAGANEPPSEVDVMHICIPCHSQKDFVDHVVNYVGRFKPELMVINSTVPPGTTEKVHRRCCVHIARSPVRGVHKSLNRMRKELKHWTKYVGDVDVRSARLIKKALREDRVKSQNHVVSFRNGVDDSVADSEIKWKTQGGYHGKGRKGQEKNTESRKKDDWDHR